MNHSGGVHKFQTPKDLAVLGERPGERPCQLKDAEMGTMDVLWI